MEEPRRNDPDSRNRLGDRRNPRAYRRGEAGTRIQGRRGPASGDLSSPYRGSENLRRSKLPAVEGEGKGLTPVDISVRQIVYATDFSPESLAGAPFATSLAQQFQAKLTLLHVIEKIEDTGRRPSSIDLALQRLEKLVPEEARLWCSPKPSVQLGPSADCILQEALNSKADLIVLGVRAAAGHLGAATHLPWTTAHKVIAQAHCPVLTIPFTAALQAKKERDGFYEFGEIIP